MTAPIRRRPTVASPPQPAPPPRPRLRRGAGSPVCCGSSGCSSLAAVGGLLRLRPGGRYRLTHSITDDAFVEAHIVNVAPQIGLGAHRPLPGRGERPGRAGPGAGGDRPGALPRPGRTSPAARWTRPRRNCGGRRPASPGSGRRSPSRSRSPSRTLAAAEADEARAKEALKLTTDEVEHGHRRGQGRRSTPPRPTWSWPSRNTRATPTSTRKTAAPLRRAQEVTRARDAAQAQRNLAAAKLAKAEAARTQIEVAKRTLEAAEKLDARRPARASIWPRPATTRSARSNC